MYPTPIRLSETTAARRRVPIWLVDATDGITAETGVTGKPNLSVNGGAPAGTTNNIVEIGAGLYYIELTAAEVGTVGPSFLSFKTAATAQWHGAIDVWDPTDIAGPVWDELQANHTTAATFGEAVNDIDTATQTATPANTAAAVWNALKANHTVNGTFGEGAQDTEISVEHLSGGGVRG